jgi:polysaccharide biosynthesis/export protein
VRQNDTPGGPLGRPGRSWSIQRFGAVSGRWPATVSPPGGCHPSAGPERLSMRWRIAAPMAVVATMLVGCARPGDGLPPLPRAPAGKYTLGPGDKIRITTFGDSQLTGEFEVGANGDVAVPLLGHIRAAGLTAAQLEDRLAGMLVHAGMFKQPSVTVEVTAYRPVFILGEVQKPGQYPYQAGMTVLTAVAIAGGFTYRAVESNYSIVRSIDGGTIEGLGRRQTLLQPGDVVTVYERRF